MDLIMQKVRSIFNKEDSELIIIWGDGNVNSDNEHVQKVLVKTYPFLKNKIFQYTTTKEFREQSLLKKYKNILFLMSGTFSNTIQNKSTNIEWINQNIENNTFHSKSIILFTSISTIRKNDWSIEKLQSKFQYVTQLTTDYELLFKSVDKMIYNRIHRSLVLTKNLDQFFQSEVKEIAQIFNTPDKFSLSQLHPSTTNLKNSLKAVYEYINKQEVTSPILLYFKQETIQSIYDQIEKCFTNGNNEDQIIQNVLKLYTQEQDNIYKVLNYSINTMNGIIYKHLASLYRLISKCLYEFEDNCQQQEINLFRGAIIQKYQYNILYKEYQDHQRDGNPCFVVFPQFTSTSLCKKIAEQIKITRSNEVKEGRKIFDLDETIEFDDLCEIDAKQLKFEKNQYLRSNQFKDNYEVLVEIKANVNKKDKLRPKQIQSISQFSKEEEFLFQPYQQFKIESMEKGNDDKSVCVKLSYDSSKYNLL